MKQIALLTIIIVFSFLNPIFAQGLKIITAGPGGKKYLVGSLGESFDSGTFEKLKISILGGNWYCSNIGENTYYISSRDGIKINRETHGGSSDNYILKVFKSTSGYDFVVEIYGEYTAIWLQAWRLDGSINTPNPMQPFPITEYNAANKTDVTSQFQVNTITASTQSGNIGIGTATPTAKLTVAGDIRAREIKVEANAGADFVFADDYRLRSLHEVEQFIVENKHLPDIAPADSMVQHGVDVGGMQIRLLQKVEELTLYVIEQEKRIKELETKLNNNNENLQ